MTLKKNFLHTNPKLLDISRFRFIVGIILGLSYSFAFYSFLYLFREVFRYLSITENYDLLVLSDAEVNFYNLFFAFLAVILGQSTCFSFWLDRPRVLGTKFNIRRITMVNDQRALNWYFLSWFSKMVVMFAIFFVVLSYGAFYAISLYPDFNYIFILAVIVLFFQTWNTIRLTFLRKSLKWLLISIIAVSAVSFGLSRINLIDYKSVNEYVLKRNINHNYNLEIPESEVYSSLQRPSLVNDIYVVTKKNKTYEPIIVVDGKEIQIEDLGQIIAEWEFFVHELERPLMTTRLHIHEEVKMEFVNKLLVHLSYYGANKIAYAVTPIVTLHDKRYYSYCSFICRNPRYGFVNTKSLPKTIPPPPPPPVTNRFINCTDNLFTISQSTVGYYFINDSSIAEKDLKEKFKDIIYSNPKYIFQFFVNDDSSFSSYFKVLSNVFSAVREVRDEYSKMTFNEELEHLYYNRYRIVQEKFPIRYFEITEDMIDITE
ncbi:MAG: hypothetical protein K9J13_04420 [Saprospiraceae bacterium]|nr:hypothetical protein [Saprospiraceae bacterium]